MRNASPITDAQFLTLLEMERDWQNQRIKLTPAEELLIFEPSLQLLQSKIAEWKEVELIAKNELKEKLRTAHESNLDEVSLTLVREWLKVAHGTEVVTAQRHIGRINHLLSLLTMPEVGGSYTEKLERARSVPLFDLVAPHTTLKHRGRLFVGFCPLHSENSPSFTIYPNQNRAWCFGCQKGGDPIAIAQLLLGYGFREAVEYLSKF